MLFRSQMQDRYAEVERERKRGPGHDAEYAQAYGELGKVLLGANYLDAAEPALLNAATLDATDLRWPYYLGHLYRSKGAIRESAQQFELALRRRPTDVPTLVWLADAYLSEGRPDEADPLVSRALTADPMSVAALYQAGRLALARGILAARNSDIVLMDEPTSSVDPRTEKLIYMRMFEAFDGKAVISSLHRLHLLTQFDYIYILRNGQVVDEGTFDHLNRYSLVFQEMWAHQRAEAYEQGPYPPLNVAL